jgi:hypothetical protein
MNIQHIDCYCPECEDVLVIDIEHIPKGVIVHYGLGLKDEELAQAVEKAFEKLSIN